MNVFDLRAMRATVTSYFGLRRTYLPHGISTARRASKRLQRNRTIISDPILSMRHGVWISIPLALSEMLPILLAITHVRPGGCLSCSLRRGLTADRSV